MTESHDQAGDRGKPAGNLDELIAALAGEDPIVRQKARQSLVAAGQAALAPLAAALSDAHTQVRWEAAKALVSTADATVAPALVKTLEDKDTGVRWLAAEALISAGPEAVPPLLQALVDRASSPWLAEGAHYVLHAMATKKMDADVMPVISALEHAAREETVPVAAFEVLRQLDESL